MRGLKGKNVLVTGGASGIGQATATRFMEEGCGVCVLDRSAEARARIAEELPELAAVIDADVSSLDQVQAAFAEAIDCMGSVDVLINNAGVFHPRTVPECTEEEWDETIDSSLKGAFLMSKYVLPSMIERGGGSIIHTSSGWGFLGGDKAAAYCAAKGGLIVMAKAMAIDHGPDGIRMNCVCPGDVQTPMLPDDAAKRGMSWEEYAAGAADRPLGRIGTAEEIADAVLFLASDESSFVTGEALVVDGGGIAG